jgi:hypothetical protein
MPFSSWADFLSGHDGATESSKGITKLGDIFGYNSSPIGQLKGEESILFLGISSDGSPLFLHHLTDLWSTWCNPDPVLVTLVGLQKSTTVIRLLADDCFGIIPGNAEDDYNLDDYTLPTFAKLEAATMPEMIGSEIECSGGGTMQTNKHCQCLIHFMWWAAPQMGDRMDIYRPSITLLMDPKPSISRWRDLLAIQVGLDLTSDNPVTMMTGAPA